MPTQNTGALAGVKVVDLSRVLAGPYATQILGDHGADVIKVEPPMGDETREWGPPFRDDNGERGPSSYYLNVNRNKRGIALDLTKPEAREVVLRLLADADILIENFKIGTMERWGMSYETLAQRFPKLIYCRISGFGSDGPLGGMPGYDAVLQAMTGLASATGSPESGPVKLGVPMVDMTTGLNSVIGILLALHERNRSGRGQFLEVALYDAGISILHPHSGNWLWGERVPKLIGNAHPNLAPYDLFQTKTRPIFLGVGNDAQFRKAMTLLGCPELIDDTRFKNNAGRNANRAELTKILAAIFAKLDGLETATKLLEAGVPAGPLNHVNEVMTDPQTKARTMVVEKDGYKGVASPIKMARTKSSTRKTPPDFGIDNDSVLKEAGYSDSDIAQLKAAGAVLTAMRS
jgi:crotonobetainyl-CoA:carnitine CoA-transferase CaiB-like acyl-CoA transferase